jgi:hypothetical protein
VPPPHPNVPRDELVFWLDADQADQDDQDEDDEELVDLSQLGNEDSDDNTVDSGVTSGADPSGWDPIDVDGNP